MQFSGRLFHSRSVWILLTVPVAFISALLLAVKGFDYDVADFVEKLLDAYDFWLGALIGILRVEELFRWLQNILPWLPELQPHWKHVFVLLWIFFAQHTRETSEGWSTRRVFFYGFGAVCALASGFAAGTSSYFEPQVFFWSFAGTFLFLTSAHAWDWFWRSIPTNVSSTAILIAGVALIAAAGYMGLTASKHTAVGEWAWDLSCVFRSPGLVALVVGAVVLAVALLLFGLPSHANADGFPTERLLRNKGRRLGATILALFAGVALVLRFLPPDSEGAIGDILSAPVIDMVRMDGTRAFTTADDFGKLERPVEVRPFLLSRMEITNRQFRQFVIEKRRRPSSTDCNWNKMKDHSFDDYPVVCINWADADAYAKWLNNKTGRNYRLPTKAEWQYAAVQYDAMHEASAFVLPWSKEDVAGCAYGNFDKAFCPNGKDRAAPVGSVASVKNSKGLEDMFGNVSEWTEEPGAGGAQAVFSALFSGACPRAMRGGSWYQEPDRAKGATQGRGGGLSPTLYIGANIHGFRLAGDPGQDQQR